jgi:hypothetical protein
MHHPSPVPAAEGPRPRKVGGHSGIAMEIFLTCKISVDFTLFMEPGSIN